MNKMKLIFERWRQFGEDSDIIAEEKNFIDKAAEFIGKALGGYGDAMTTSAKSADDAVIGASNKLIQAIDRAAGNMGIPLHARAFAKFLSGSDEPFTEDSLTEKEKEALRAAAKMLMSKAGLTASERKAFKKGVDKRLKPGGKKRISYPHWRILSKKSSPKDYKTYNRLRRKRMKGRGAVPLKQKVSVFSGEVFASYQRFLGNAVFELDRSGNITVYDQYDFNNASKKADLNDLYKDLWEAIKPSMHGGDDMYNAIRRMAPYRQATGYAGYAVKIQISLNM